MRQKICGGEVMKKLVLVMTCILILTIFIALNYLLWDRENKIQNFESLNSSKSASIDTLGEKIKNLDDVNKRLNERVNELETNNKALVDKNNQLTQEKSLLQINLDNKTALMDKYKHQLDMKFFEDQIRSWAENIEKGQYDAAFDLQSKDALKADGVDNFNDFANKFRKIIKTVKVKSVKFELDGLPEDKKDFIVIKAALDVKKIENSGKSIFEDGVNERYFTFAFDTAKNNWVISSISLFP